MSSMQVTRLTGLGGLHSRTSAWSPRHVELIVDQVRNLRPASPMSEGGRRSLAPEPTSAATSGIGIADRISRMGDNDSPVLNERRGDKRA